LITMIGMSVGPGSSRSPSQIAAHDAVGDVILAPPGGVVLDGRQVAWCMVTSTLSPSKMPSTLMSALAPSAWPHVWQRTGHRLVSHRLRLSVSISVDTASAT
jgi:hypothetical protein